MRYFADERRHLICVPYTRENLLAMADDLDIPRHWYHGGTYPHIDMPARQVIRILDDPRVTIVSPREIVMMARPDSGLLH